MVERVALAESYDPGLFTDRDFEFGKLMEIAELAMRGGGYGIALLGHRRMGKTALLEKLYNTLFFEQRRVVPFYFALRKATVNIRELAREWMLTTLRQYLAFRFRNPLLLKTARDFDSLAEYMKKLGNPDVERFLLSLTRLANESSYTLWDTAITLPEAICTLMGESGVYMIDEFQYINQHVYTDTTSPRLLNDLAGSFQRLAESRTVPMVVAGSQVTILSREVLGGPLAGRFTPLYLGPLQAEDAILLVYRLAEKYGKDITDEVAAYLIELTQGHPFYLARLISSAYPDPDVGLGTIEEVNHIYKYEITRGGIAAFWSEHFEENMQMLNMGEGTRRLLFGIIRHQEKHPEEILTARRLSEELQCEYGEVKNRLLQLLRADLVEEDPLQGISLRDKVLQDVLKLKFAEEIENLSPRAIQAEIDQHLAEENQRLREHLQKQQGFLSHLLGEAGETAIRGLARRLSGRQVEGRYFHVAGQIHFPRFHSVRPLSFMALGREYEVDVFAEGREGVLVAEVKNWKNPVGVEVIREFFEKYTFIREGFHLPEVLRQGWVENRMPIIGWIYARSGFTEEAIRELREEGLLYSQYEDCAALWEELL